MHVRPMLRSDVPAATDVALAAFTGDSVYAWISPGASDPALKVSARRGYIDRFYARICNPANVGIVCVESIDGDVSKEEVIGYAWFSRTGDERSATQRAWTANAQSMGDWFERKIAIPLTEAYEYYIARNPTKNYDNMYRLRQSTAAQDWAGCIPSRWEVAVLGVHPKHHRRGAGKMMLNWVLGQARQEGVPVVLDATIPGRPVYEKLGFRGVDWMKLSVENGRGDGYCMVLDLSGKRVRDLEPGEQNWVEYGGQRREIEATWTDEALESRRLSRCK